MRNRRLTWLLHLFCMKKCLLVKEKMYLKSLLEVPLLILIVSIQTNGCRADSFAPTMSLTLGGFGSWVSTSPFITQKLTQESAAVCKCRLSSVRVWELDNIQMNCPMEIRSIEVKELGVKTPLIERHGQGLAWPRFQRATGSAQPKCPYLC